MVEQEVRRTVCNRDCPDSCGMLVTVRSGRAVKLTGDPEHPLTRGFLCYRTNQFLKRQYSPDRVLRPLLRQGGKLQPVSWESALDYAAEQLLKIRTEDGGAAILHYRSGGSLGLLKAVTDRFFHHFGPVTVKRGDICSGAGEAAQHADFGLSDSGDPETILHSKHIVLWGKNVHTSSPHTIPLLKQAQARGARILLVDPISHAGRRLAEKYFQPRPGGDLALALAIGQLLFQRGWVHPEADRYCDGLAEFRELCLEHSEAELCKWAGVSAEAVQDLAACFREGPTCVLLGWGMARRSNGGHIIRALDSLCAVSGNVGIEGGGAHYYSQRRAGFDLSALDVSTRAPRTICEPLFGREILSQRSPRIRALWVTAGNPVAMLPDSNTNARAISQLELSVVVDSFLTDTARLASLVLPTTTLLEDDDLIGSYGHPYVAESRPAVEPPAEVRSDLVIIQGLAERVGLSRVVEGTASEWKQRLLGKAQISAGMSMESLAQSYVRNPASPRIAFEGKRFSTKTQRAQLLTSCQLAEPSQDPAFPLTLLALSTREAQSSQWAEHAPDVAAATVHPAAARGLEEGSLARLSSRIGSMTVRIKLDATQREDVVLLPKGGHLYNQTCANALIEARLTDMGEGGALYEQPVRLQPLD